MIFDNVNNLQIVTEFENLFSETLCKEYPELSQDKIQIYTEEEGDGFIKKWCSLDDSPYISNYLAKEIMRSNEICSRCNFTREEEMAIIAHELGHYVAGRRGEKSEDGFEEERKADQMAVKIGLGKDMASAITKMVGLNIHPENNPEMKKRITQLIQIAK